MATQYPVVESAPISAFGMERYGGYGIRQQDTVYATSVPSGAHSAQPTFLQILTRLVLRRWKLFIAWCAVGAALAAVAIALYGKPVWRSEGTLIYEPAFGKVFRRLTTPPNIQTVLQRMKDPEMLEQVHADLKLPGLPGSLKNLVKFDVVRSTDLIGVTVDDAIKDQANLIAARLMELGIKHHEEGRRTALETALSEKEQEKARLGEERNRLISAHEAELGRLGVLSSDIRNELENTAKMINDGRVKLEEMERELGGLPKQIESAQNVVDDAKRDNKLSPTIMMALNEMKRLINDLEQKITVDEIELKEALILWDRQEPARRLGAMSRDEISEKRTKIEQAQVRIAKNKELLVEYKTRSSEKLQEFEASLLASPMQVLNSLKARLDTLKINDIPSAKSKIADKEKRMSGLGKIREKYAPQIQEIDTKQHSIETIDQIITENRALLDVSTQELKVSSAASAGNAPVSSNYPKLAAGVFATMTVLFVGFVIARDMPRYSLSGDVTARQLSLPVLTHYSETPATLAIADGSVPVSMPVRQLADQLRNRFPERGSIILFTPATAAMNIGALIGDVASYVGQSAGKVLVFDARDTRAGRAPDVPAWIGAQATDVGQRVEEYLEGKNDKPLNCFIATQVSGVEYSRAGLSKHVNNMIGMYRFHRLVEEMRERFGMILLISPAVPQDIAEEQYLHSLVDGSILVLDGQHNPSHLQSYVDLMRASDSPLMGTVVVEQRGKGW